MTRENASRNITIMRLYFSGLSYGQIATQLRISRDVVAGVIHRSTYSNRGGQRRPFENLSGQTFGRLLVIERAENDVHGTARFKCECECGATKIVRSYDLKSLRVKSCGCLLTVRSAHQTKSRSVA